METVDRFKGCLLGLAVGDALGTTLEFKKPGTFHPINDIVGGGPFNLQAGQWTDDTSLALCLAESLIERKTFDPLDQLERYVRWYRHGHNSSTGECFDIGNTTRSAILLFEKTHEPYCGMSDTYSSGNGSIMRLAPVPMFYSRNPLEAIERSGESSRTTHGTIIAIDACRYLGALIVGALNGASKEELLSKRYAPVPDYWDENPLDPEVDAVTSGSFKRKDPPAIQGSGYVVKSLEAALWAFYKSNSFKEGALLAVNLGDDADTTGAVYGQLAGAFYGLEGIPKNWIDKVYDKELIIDFSEEIYKLSLS